MRELLERVYLLRHKARSTGMRDIPPEAYLAISREGYDEMLKAVSDFVPVFMPPGLPLEHTLLGIPVRPVDGLPAGSLKLVIELDG